MGFYWKSAVVGGIAASSTVLGLVAAGPAQATPATTPAHTCTQNVDGSGLSAAVVAKSHQRIANQTINATGCDIGIYIGPRASHVSIDHVTVENANFQGILAQKTSHILIENSTITENGWHTIDPTIPVPTPMPPGWVQSHVSQSFGVSLFGVSHSRVENNQVSNNGRGGIGVMDNGPNDPGTITQNANAPLTTSSHDVLVGNFVTENYSGCGIVVATQNVGGALSNLRIVGNTVKGTGFSSPASQAHGAPDIGGIVVAADPPGSSVRQVVVRQNRVTDSFEGGIIVNAEAPNSFTQRVTITGNVVSGNNIGHLEAPNTAGVIVFAAPAPGAQNRDTVVSSNWISGQFYGIWSMGDFAPTTRHNHITVTSGGSPISHS